MKKYGVIYKIENLVNNKIYIGQTKNSFKENGEHFSKKLLYIYEGR